MTVSKAGAGAARNAGLKMAKGEFIAFLDDDDVWLAANISAQVKMLRAEPRARGGVRAGGDDGQALRPEGEPWPAIRAAGDALVKAMLSAYYPQLGATVVRASVAREIGLFDEAAAGGPGLGLAAADRAAAQGGRSRRRRACCSGSVRRDRSTSCG